MSEQSAEGVRCKLCGAEFPHDQWHTCPAPTQSAEKVRHLGDYIPGWYRFCWWLYMKLRRYCGE